MTKSKRNRNEPYGRVQDPHVPERGVSPLLRRLMEKVTGQRQEQQRNPGSRPPLPQAGGRSGTGADSVTPYLEETRNSRPAPLE